MIAYIYLIFNVFPFSYIVTVIEILPKEKKQKEEKTTILGQCTVDLLPVIKGEYHNKNKHFYDNSISC